MLNATLDKCQMNYCTVNVYGLAIHKVKQILALGKKKRETVCYKVIVMQPPFTIQLTTMCKDTQRLGKTNMKPNLCP